MPRSPEASLPSTTRWRVPLGSILVAVCTFLVAYGVFATYGPIGLTMLTGVVVGMVVLAIVSVRSVELAVLVWLFTLLGFRSVLILPTPGLPDLTGDRVMLLWAASAFAVRFLSQARRLERPLAIDTLMLAHMFYLLVSCLIVNPLAINLWTRSYLMPTAGFFFGKYLFREKRWFMRAVYLLLAVNFYHSFTAIVEHFRIMPLVWPRHIIELEGNFQGRSVGLFGQPAVLGVYIGMMIPLHFYLHVTSRRAPVRWLHLVGLGLSFGGLLYTYTRGPWLGAFVGLSVLGFMGARVYLRRLALYGAITILIVAGGFLGLRQDRFLQERIGTEHTIRGRVNAMGTAFRMFLDHPIFGIGFRHYNELKQDYRQTMHVPIFGLIKAQEDKTATLHDIYIGILAEEGLVGTAMQVAIYLLLLRLLLGARARGPGYDPHVASHLVPVIGAVMACYLVGGLSFDYRFFTTLNSVFYFFGGVLAGWAALRHLGASPGFTPSAGA